MTGLLLAAALLCGCKPPNFDPPSKIGSVRILATAADKPYAKPGDTVTMTVLAFDGRPSKPKPMGVWWLPQTCMNPAGDLYYDCYSSFGLVFHPGIDLTPQLTAATTFAFQMPLDAIASHNGQRGGDPYGLAVAFVIACAGHVEYIPPAGGAANALPFGCFDDNHERLGPDEFVFAYSLVYAFSDRANANPVIDHLSLDGNAVDPVIGISLDQCTRPNIDDCPTVSLDAVVPATSQELDPANIDAKGDELGEEVWIDYYLTAGKVKSDTVILFDPHLGALSKGANALTAPQAAGAYLLWVVAHDNRGGVSWIQVPFDAH
jgi:hypothetical protein